MTFVWGLLSFLQMFFIPGLLMGLKKPQYNLLDLMLFIPISMLINFLLVMFLSAIHLYTPFAMRTLVISEIFILATFFWRQKRTIRIDLNLSRNPIFLIALFFTLSGLVRWIREWGGIYTSWDSVVSWNAWAMEFGANHWPIATNRYPQLLPTNLSLSYALMGNTSLQFFSFASITALEFFSLLTLFLLGAKSSFFYLLIPGVAYFPRKMMEVFSGGGDITLFYFSLISVCALLLLQKNAKKNQEKEEQNYMLIGISGALAAAMTKQSGFLLCLAFLIQLRFLQRKWWKKGLFLTLGGIIFLMVVEEVRMRLLNGTPAPDLSGAIGLSWQDRPLHALKLLHKIIVLFRWPEWTATLWQLTLLSTMILAVIKEKFTRPFFIFFMLYLPIWVMVTSYDTRNLCVVLPHFILILAMGIHLLIPKIQKQKVLKKEMPLRFLLLGFSFLALICGLNFNEDKWQKRQAYLSNHIGHKELGEYLQHFFEKHPLPIGKKIATQYTLMDFMPLYRGKTFIHHFASEEILRSHPEVDYLLLYYPAEKMRLMAAEMEGKKFILPLQTFQNGDIRFYAINEAIRSLEQSVNSTDRALELLHQQQ